MSASRRPRRPAAPPIDDDADDFRLLGLANDKRKFALGVTFFEAGLQRALERGIDRDWFRLVDVTYIAETRQLMRIFRLTDAGMERLAELAARRRQ